MDIISKYKNKISFFLNNKDDRKSIQLYYWSPNDHRGKENFGDYLSEVIVRGVIGKYFTGISNNITYETNSKHRNLLAIGSIIHHSNDNDIIWGSGVNGKSLGQKIKSRALDVRMVRGPLTRRFLLRQGIACPTTYGEPGLLVSELLRSNTTNSESKKYPFSLVLNLNDVPLYGNENYIVYPNWELERVIARIRASEIVISTSLHGLVIAEAYGIPARHLLSFAEPTFKYIDYYKGTGRSGVRFAQTLEEALDLGGVDPPQYDPQKMIDCFPIDLISRNKSV